MAEREETSSVGVPRKNTLPPESSGANLAEGPNSDSRRENLKTHEMTVALSGANAKDETAHSNSYEKPYGLYGSAVGIMGLGKSETP